MKMNDSGVSSLNYTSNPELSAQISIEVACIISFLIFVTGLAGNGFICYVYLRFRQLRSLTNYFVLNLAVADLVLISVLIPWIIQDLLGNPNKMIVFNLLMNTDILCSSASMLNLAAVSVDRYCAVVSPLRYPAIVTRSRARKAVLLIWVYSLTMAGVGIARSFTDVINSTVFITVLASISCFLPTAIIIFSHLSIFRIAWLTKKPSSVLQTEFEIRKRKVLAPRIKLSINTLIILVPMAIAWGAFYGITVFEAHTNARLNIPPALEFTVGILPHVAAAVDPIVYLLVTRDLRDALKGMCKCIQKERARTNSECNNWPAHSRNVSYDKRNFCATLVPREEET